jgi:hypothetical protein
MSLHRVKEQFVLKLLLKLKTTVKQFPDIFGQLKSINVSRDNGIFKKLHVLLILVPLCLVFFTEKDYLTLKLLALLLLVTTCK